MQETLEMINLDSIDKTDWESFPFEKIAHRISETVDPKTTELEVYVGLEHIDAEDIHIRRFGSPKDVTGGKLKCYPGDVIFGKRRAYQRKAAIAEFEGICSAHAFVFRANSDIIDPKLFPFFLHSDQFMHRMVDISVGGLSPTINWGDLKEQEFLLPPKSEQARLAELLWAMDEVVEKEKRVLDKNYLLKTTQLNKIFTIKGKRELRRLESLCKISSGNSAPQGDLYFKDGRYPFIRMQHLNNLKHGKYPVNYDLVNEIAIAKKKLKLIKKGSILLAKSGESIRSEKKAILEYDSYVVNHLAILSDFTDEIFSKYLFYFFQNFKLTTLISQTTTPSISLQDLKRIKVPFMEINDQKKISSLIQIIDNSITSSEAKKVRSLGLQKSLINQIF